MVENLFDFSHPPLCTPNKKEYRNNEVKMMKIRLRGSKTFTGRTQHRKMWKVIKFTTRNTNRAILIGNITYELSQ